MPASLPPAEPLQALAERVVAVVRRRVDLEQRLERRARALGLAGVVVRPAERLEDRALARLEPVGPLEDDRGLGVVASLEQRLAALEQLVGGLALVGVGASSGRDDSMRRWWHGARDCRAERHAA